MRQLLVRPAASRTWGRMAAWMQIVTVVAFTATPALAHDPIERLQKGDYQGFLDDALRTDWVVATTTGGLAGILAPALAAAMQAVLAEGRRIADLDQAVRDCLKKLRDMSAQYDRDQAELDYLKGRYADIVRALERYGQAEWAWDATRLGWLIYGAVGLIKGALYVGGQYLTPEVAAAGGGSALTGIRAMQWLQTCKERLAEAASRLAMITARTAQATTEALRRLSQMELEQAQGRFLTATEDVRAAQAAVDRLAETVSKPGPSVLSQVYQLGGQGVGLACSALATVKSSGIKAFQDFRAEHHMGQRPQFEQGLRQFKSLLDRKSADLDAAAKAMTQQRSHCDAIAAELDALVQTHQKTLTEAQRIYREWQAAGGGKAGPDGVPELLRRDPSPESLEDRPGSILMQTPPPPTPTTPTLPPEAKP